MIIVTIGEASRRLTSSAAAERWVTLQMRAAGEAEPPAVHVRIVAACIALNLSAGASASAVSSNRALTPTEQRVVTLWEQRGLDRSGFRSGQVVAFLHQLHDLLEQGSVAVRCRVSGTRPVHGGLHRSAAHV